MIIRYVFTPSMFPNQEFPEPGDIIECKVTRVEEYPDGRTLVIYLAEQS
jgi:hypothetical protein